MSLVASISVTAPAVAADRHKKATVTCTSNSSDLAARLEEGIAKAVASRDSAVSVALYDRRTGTSCAYDEKRQQDAASTVKPIILGALLFHNQGPLNGEDDALARKMITASDNDSTLALWEKLSDLTNPDAPDPVKIQSFIDRAGMNDTILDKEASFGLSRVNAADQLRLLELFTSSDDTKTPVLTQEARTYALDLMNQVQSDQRWGAPAGAPANAAVHVKNGWLQRSDNPDVDPYDRLDWKVNSMAAFTGDGYDYGLVVLTENNKAPAGHPAESGWIHGINTVEEVARPVHRGLSGE